MLLFIPSGIAVASVVAPCLLEVMWIGEGLIEVTPKRCATERYELQLPKCHIAQCKCLACLANVGSLPK